MNGENGQTPVPEFGQMAPVQHEETQAMPASASHKAKRKAMPWIPIVAAVVGLAIGFAAGYPIGRYAEANDKAKAAAQAHQESVDKYKGLIKNLSDVVSNCQPTDSWAQTSDSLVSHADGSLSLTSSKYSVNSTLECVELALDMPSSLTSQIGMTNAYNGVQKENFGDYTVTWSYNGSKGLDFTVAPTMENPEAK